MSILTRNLVSKLVLGISIPVMLVRCGGDDTQPAAPGDAAAGVGGSVGTGGKVGVGGTTADGSVDAAKDGTTGTGGTTLDASPGAGGALGTGGSTPGSGGTSPGVGGSDASVVDGGNTGGTAIPDGGSETGLGGTNNVGGTNNAGGYDAGVDGSAAGAGGTSDAGLDAADATIDVEASSTLCASGCAVASNPMSADGGGNTNGTYFGVLFPPTNLDGATVTFRYCVKSGLGGLFTLFVKDTGWTEFTGAGYQGYKASTGAGWASLGCDSGMHEVSYPIATGGYNFVASSATRVGVHISQQDGSGPYADPTVVYIDSITFTNLPADAGSLGPFTFAPGSDGGADLQGFSIDPITASGTISWTNGN